MNKDMIHIYDEVLLSHKKAKMPFAATWMQLEIFILSKSERKRQILYDIIYMKNLKYGTNEPTYKTEIRHREPTCGYQATGMVREGRIGSLRLVDAN